MSKKLAALICLSALAMSNAAPFFGWRGNNNQDNNQDIGHDNNIQDNQDNAIQPEQQGGPHVNNFLNWFQQNHPQHVPQDQQVEAADHGNEEEGQEEDFFGPMDGVDHDFELEDEHEDDDAFLMDQADEGEVQAAVQEEEEEQGTPPHQIMRGLPAMPGAPRAGRLIALEDIPPQDPDSPRVFRNPRVQRNLFNAFNDADELNEQLTTPEKQKNDRRIYRTPDAPKKDWEKRRRLDFDDPDGGDGLFI